MAKKTVTAKKRVVKVGAQGQLHVHSSFNNVIVSLANSEGQIISWSSAGKMGFRGSKKNTPYAAQMAAQDCGKVAYDLGLRKVVAYVKGPGNGREAAIRGIHGCNIEVTEIIDEFRQPLASYFITTPDFGCIFPFYIRCCKGIVNERKSDEVSQIKTRTRIWQDIQDQSLGFHVVSVRLFTVQTKFLRSAISLRDSMVTTGARSHPSTD